MGGGFVESIIFRIITPEILAMAMKWNVRENRKDIW